MTGQFLACISDQQSIRSFIEVILLKYASDVHEIAHPYIPIYNFFVVLNRYTNTLNSRLKEKMHLPHF